METSVDNNSSRPSHSFPLVTETSSSQAVLPGFEFDDIASRRGGSQHQPHPNYRPRPRHDVREQQRSDDNPIDQTIKSIRSAFETIGQNLKSRDMLPDDDALLPTFVSGTLAFYATAFSSQCVQHKLLKMSTGTRPAFLPASVGVLTVALGSWMGHLAGLGTVASWGRIRDSWSWRDDELLREVPRIGRAALRSVEDMARPMKVAFVLDGHYLSESERRERREAWMHAARICVIGLLTYKVVFRSRFSSLSPSSYTARGSFARAGIPAPPNFNYATRLQRLQIERIGQRWGCHTCGSRMMFSNLGNNFPKFHGDHIPPVSVAKQLEGRWYRKMFGMKVKQKFYPQCRNCSNKQGGMLAKAISAGHKNLRAVGGGEESYFHGRRIRISHLTGGTVAVASVAGINNGSLDEDVKGRQLVQESRERVCSLQDSIIDLGKGLMERVESFRRDIR